MLTYHSIACKVLYLTIKPLVRLAPSKELRNNKGLCGNVSSLKACPSSITWSKNLSEERQNNVVIIFLVSILSIMFLSMIVFGILYVVLKRPRLRNKINNAREAQNSTTFVPLCLSSIPF